MFEPLEDHLASWLVQAGTLLIIDYDTHNILAYCYTSFLDK